MTQKGAYTGMNVTIREAIQHDYDAVNSLIKETQEEHAAALPGIFAHVDHVVAMGWYRSFSDHNHKTVLIAEWDHIPVGVAMLELKKSPAYAALVPRSYVQLNEIAVTAKHRRKGIGRKLVESAVQWAKDRNALSLELNVWEFNQAAIGFYQSMGLVTLNRTMQLCIGYPN
jgi:GNAT superfamily N-acetyltransferase